ncbi:hypothetical protein [Humibacter sp.]|uniref:hypothetical protein n=1 Tax=Humibacter sp. TaxID=1940291 RepID=UPI003F82132C
MFGYHANAAGADLTEAHAEVEALLGRLGHDISTLDDAGDATNRQALADAAERYNTAGAQLSKATTLGEITVARPVVVEGLHSTRLVRTRLGLDPGVEPTEAPATQPTAGRDGQHGGGLLGSGLAGALGAGAAGGLLGMVAGSLLGEGFEGDGGDGGGWDGGGWGDDV